MKEQTAVDFLISKLPMSVKCPMLGAIEQAKAKEREQIEQAYRDGFSDGEDSAEKDFYIINPIEYYNQKYGSETSCEKCGGIGWYYVDEWIGNIQGRKDCKCKTKKISDEK